MRTRWLSYGRETGPGPDQGWPKLSDGLVKQGAKSAWDRITAPSLADCGRCLRLGEVREEWILTRSLSARRWEADRCSPWCQAISTGSLIDHDPGQARVQGSGLRKGPAGGPGSTRSI